MNLVRVIKRNKELKPYFLNFIRHSVILDQFPEAEEGQSSKYAEADDNYDDAIRALYQKLQDSYGISDPEQMEKIITEVAESYMKEYPFEAILKMTENIEAPSPSVKREEMEQALREQSNYCLTCKSPRKEMSFEELPDEEKESFRNMAFEPEYYLYCPKCNKYSVMSKSEGWGF